MKTNENTAFREANPPHGRPEWVSAERTPAHAYTDEGEEIFDEIETRYLNKWPPHMLERTYRELGGVEEILEMQLVLGLNPMLLGNISPWVEWMVTAILSQLDEEDRLESFLALREFRQRLAQKLD